jgi:hypothetical protein
VVKENTHAYLELPKDNDGAVECLSDYYPHYHWGYYCAVALGVVAVVVESKVEYYYM